jgi:hypothetical protein
MKKDNVFLIELNLVLYFVFWLPYDLVKSSFHLAYYY